MQMNSAEMKLNNSDDNISFRRFVVNDWLIF